MLGGTGRDWGNGPGEHTYPGIGWNWQGGVDSVCNVGSVGAGGGGGNPDPDLDAGVYLSNSRQDVCIDEVNSNLYINVVFDSDQTPGG